MLAVSSCGLMCEFLLVRSPERVAGGGGNKHSEGWSAEAVKHRETCQSGSPQGDGRESTEGNGEKADVLLICFNC